MSINPIQTTYRGHRFRSRLEARWALFMDRAGVEWQYETQGFMVGTRPYLPDFYLPGSDTWVEVKGTEAELDHDLMMAAPEHLPGGRLLILGPVPEPPKGGNWAWLRLSLETPPDGGEPVVFDGWWQFGDGGLLEYASETSCAPPVTSGDEEWLIPALNMVDDVAPRIIDAYRAARSARFEHGAEGAI